VHGLIGEPDVKKLDGWSGCPYTDESEGETECYGVF